MDEAEGKGRKNGMSYEHHEVQVIGGMLKHDATTGPPSVVHW